ncbi:MBL fold metallo-hydrolase [Colidextribacter sp. OB.20]|uniref:MBL fold metallo-hydrolase n=1 Tax=Colidextribacter sp. OB.20 TaxID=2304568 RepID=UPI0013720FE1|nr:MBL fold metallo-hydrolase [Colidextribacter sp. OB.20]NBI10823.1 MBL fold metallo-hydrolase [Colidextribacter sp. OB.20]
MRVKMMQVGPIGTNCYILEEDKKIAVIDPGDEAERILSVLKETEGAVEYILLTHGHYDHTTAVPELHEALPEAKIYIHRADANGAGNTLFPLAGQVEGLLFYGEGDALPLGSLTVEVLHTPGHSPGSVTLKAGEALFTGDTLFAGSMGRTDLPGGDEGEIMASLKRLGGLEGNFHVLPGHMGASELDRERRSNPYLRMAMG